MVWPDVTVDPARNVTFDSQVVNDEAPRVFDLFHWDFVQSLFTVYIYLKKLSPCMFSSSHCIFMYV